MHTRAVPAKSELALLKPFWSDFAGPAWVVSLAVYAVVVLARFLAFFSPYSLQVLFFLQAAFMWAVPFIFLTPAGQRRIGLREKGTSITSILLSLFAGGGFAIIFFAMGTMLYGDSPDSWCISIRDYLHLDEMRGLMPPLGLFALYALPAMFLNPIGEEILFRGFIRESFSERFSPAIGVIVNLALFAPMYISLHGLWRDAAGLHLRVGSAAMAVLLMVCVGGIFTACRMLTGSLWPAIAAHAGFNVGILASAIHQYAR
jgi:hypothetical protein